MNIISAITVFITLNKKKLKLKLTSAIAISSKNYYFDKARGLQTPKPSLLRSGKTRCFNAIECNLSFDKLQVDFALNLYFLNFFYDPTVVSGCNELDIPVF